MIFNIQRYSTHDGPGIRTVVFLKGCSLSCRWCQNPESESHHQELLYDQRFCIQECQLCTSQFPHIFNKTEQGLNIKREVISYQDYQALKNLCPSTALQVCGERRQLAEIMAELKKDEAFYQKTGGGITLSGGEPFMQPEFAEALLRECHQLGYHTAVETCLHTPWKHIQPSIPHLDLMLADLKHVDEQRFYEWTGGSAKRILKNYQHLAQQPIEVIIRVPVIPDFNADEQSLTKIIDFVSNETQAKEIHFLPYHTLGVNKYKMLDKPYLAPTSPLNNEPLLEFAKQYAKQKHLTPILRG